MPITILKNIWGHQTFRKNQEGIIKSIMEGNDTVVILPTGGGKSLCYQLPAIAQEGMAIVVSPLIALMKEQVDFLKSKGIEARFINSSLNKQKRIDTQEKILSGNLKLLYVAPETLNKIDSIHMLKQVKVSFIAVDEAHCISDWGHDFRPEYRKLSHTIKEIGNIPIIALTATATAQMQRDIVRNLNMKNPNIFIDSFDRANLFYEIKPKVNVEKQIIQFIKKQKHKIGIIYCQKKKESEELAQFLQNNGIMAKAYHAGLDDATRDKTQDDFLHNKIDVIVATIAFGMGINKLNIRFVLHHSTPKSLESYYQQTGRGGRDQKPAHCLLFYNPKDIAKLDSFNKNKPIGEKTKFSILLKEVDHYALSGVCRRKQILQYFGEVYESPCNYCDNCLNPVETYDGTYLMQQLLGTVEAVHEKHDDDYIMDILIGNSIARIVNNAHEKLPFFGKCKNKEHLLNATLRQAFLLNYVTRDIEEIANIKLTDNGLAFLKNPHTLNLYKNHSYNFDEEENSMEKKLLVDNVLLKKLYVLLEKEAKKYSLKSHWIFQSSTLENMAIYYPTTIESLGTMRGVGSVKAKKFGGPFVALISDYIKTNAIVPSNGVAIRLGATKYANKKQLIQYIDRKMPLEMIAQIIMIPYQNLLTAIEELIAEGIHLDLNYHINALLSPDQQEDLYAYFEELEEYNIEEVCRELEDEYSEEEIRLMYLKFLEKVIS